MIPQFENHTMKLEWELAFVNSRSCLLVIIDNVQQCLRFLLRFSPFFFRYGIYG